MEARGLGASTLGQIDEITAKIQADVGSFLGARKRLLNIINQTLDLTIRGKAEGLLATQTSLEGELSDVTKIIDKVNEGSYTISDIVTAGAFYYSMEKQLSNVEDLESDFSGAPRQAGFTGFEMLLLALLAGGIIYGVTKGRR